MEFEGEMKIEMFERDGDYPDLPILYLSRPHCGWVPANFLIPAGQFLKVKLEWWAEKPPIGIMSRITWLEQRKEELMAAINRYREAGLDVPQAWRDECVAIRAELDRGYYTV